ncbi:hypothetical protein EUGRSUZ_C01990 [Eucalyptus grandis]|uniref:Uncharacterized protein n=2 Tax=Eucalyptus grandis TaxID=71139 RepID=A0ACC3LDU8_EUCGR|nr:hypothetical protein EUGRSUZ_C01990 [Eucalyptus grandis]
MTDHTSTKQTSEGMRIGFRINRKIMGVENKFHSNQYCLERQSLSNFRQSSARTRSPLVESCKTPTCERIRTRR